MVDSGKEAIAADALVLIDTYAGAHVRLRLRLRLWLSLRLRLRLRVEVWLSSYTHAHPSPNPSPNPHSNQVRAPEVPLASCIDSVQWCVTRATT